MNQHLLRVQEVALLLRVSKWTVYRWVEEGRLEATKISRSSLRIFSSSVGALLETNRLVRLSDAPSLSKATGQSLALPVRGAQHRLISPRRQPGELVQGEHYRPAADAGLRKTTGRAPTRHA
jgi:excisionase family DNA binding protein